LNGFVKLPKMAFAYQLQSRYFQVGWFERTARL